MRMLEGDERVALAGRVRSRQWPVLVSVLVLVSGMLYSLLWGPVIRHHNTWVVPGDIWSAYRSAHFIGWGSLGSVYAAGTNFVTFPGILLLFAPLALLTGGLGLAENFPFAVPHPTAWLLLGPYEILIGCAALFACDALAQRLRVVGRPAGGAVRGRGGGPVAHTRDVGTPRGRLGSGPRGVRDGARPRRAVDRCGLALWRRRRDPAARDTDAPGAVRHGGPATRPRPARSIRCACSGAASPRPWLRSSTTRRKFFSSNPTSPTSTTPRRGRRSPPDSGGPGRIWQLRPGRVVSWPCSPPVCSVGGRVAGAIGPICWCGPPPRHWPCAASRNP